MYTSSEFDNVTRVYCARLWRMQQQADLLIIFGSHFLEEVRHSLPFRAAEAAGLKELHHILTRSMEHDVTCICNHTSLKSCRCDT